MEQNKQQKPEIPMEEVLRYLGHRPGQDLSGSLPLLERAQTLIRQEMAPRVLTKRFPLLRTPQGLRPQGTALLLSGGDMEQLLRNSEDCILMVATLGGQVERLITRYTHSDLALAVILDAAATAAIEALCDETQATLASTLAAGGEALTMRFSPGYGDLPLRIQNDFLAVMDAPRAIGLHATPDHILLPRKSVTAVMGVVPLGSETQAKGCGAGDRACQNCPAYHSCNFRRRTEPSDE